MSERLFHHDPGVPGQAGAGEAVHGPAEQRGRDLQIEHRLLRPLMAAATF